MVITTASILAGMAVQECVNLIQKKYSPMEKENGGLPLNPPNYLYIVDKEHSLLRFEKTKKDNCPGHALLRTDLIIHHKKFSIDYYVNDIQKEIQEYFQADKVEISSDKEIVYSLNCKHCGEIQNENPIYLGKFKRPLCQRCKSHKLRPFFVSNQLLEEYSLRELNIPENHLLECRYQKNDEIKECWIEII
jgi:hypothetical protein